MGLTVDSTWLNNYLAKTRAKKPVGGVVRLLLTARISKKFTGQIAAEISYLKFPGWRTAAMLNLVQLEGELFDLPRTKTVPWNQTQSWSDHPFQSYHDVEISKIAASRHLGFCPTGNTWIQSAVLENPTVEKKHEADGMTCSRNIIIWGFQDGGSLNVTWCRTRMNIKYLSRKI